MTRKNLEKLLNGVYILGLIFYPYSIYLMWQDSYWTQFPLIIILIAISLPIPLVIGGILALLATVNNKGS
jgi:hypothetical protein